MYDNCVGVDATEYLTNRFCHDLFIFMFYSIILNFIVLDDELPDYIMVMIANKKTEKQMNNDLNLFLSHNTEKFTSW